MNNKILGIILLVVAAGLAWYGYDSTQSVSGKISGAISGGPTDRVLLFYAGAVVCGLLGVFKLK